MLVLSICLRSDYFLCFLNIPLHVFTRCTCRFAAPLYTNMCSFCVIFSLPRWFLLFLFYSTGLPQFVFGRFSWFKSTLGPGACRKQALSWISIMTLLGPGTKKAGSHFCFAIGLEGVSPYIFVSFSCFLLGSAEDIHGKASTGNVAWTLPQAMSNHWVRIGDQEIQKCAAPEPG